MRTAAPAALLSARPDYVAVQIRAFHPDQPAWAQPLSISTGTAIGGRWSGSTDSVIARGLPAGAGGAKAGLLAAAALAVIAGLFAFKAAAKMPDFEVYWRAGVRAHAAEPLYRETDEHFQFNISLHSRSSTFPLACCR